MIGATTRRALLTGGTAALAIAAAPAGGACIDADARRWDAAHRVWQAAEANALSLSASAHSLPEQLASDEAWDAEGAAWRFLINMPAPHGRALLWKLEYLMKVSDNGDSEAWEGVVVAPVMADARRMLGGAA